LKQGDKVSLSIPPPAAQKLEPEEVAFTIIYEDEALLVIDKPAGLVVHPAPGHATGTLVQGLLHHCGGLSEIGGTLRPGIVHRLDKDTSGLMVVAKNDGTHASLSRQFKSGMVRKEYVALVHGQVQEDEARIDLPIGRHPKKRKEMSVAFTGGRRALTIWRKMKVFESGFSLLSLTIKTGRTHQIRVHLAHRGHPVAGDPVYGYGKKWWKGHDLYKTGILSFPNRQMLHSRRLGFVHPDRNRCVEFEAPPPEDMENVLAALEWLELKGRVNKDLDIRKKRTIVDLSEKLSYLSEDSV